MKKLFKSKPDKIKRVAVLGCGPTGIFAAHAAINMGFDVQLFSRRRRSEMYGSQYLHAPIPGLTKSPARKIKHILIGKPEDYAPKVYGEDHNEPVHSWLTTDEMAWDIREAYYSGFFKYRDLITDVENISGRTFGSNYPQPHKEVYEAFTDPHCLLISTIPAHMLCVKMSHNFRSRNILAAGEAFERGVFLDDYNVEKDTVTHNSEKSPSWYRAANIFEHKTIEWPAGTKVFTPHATVIQKVLGTDCDCWEGAIMKVGRQGSWTRHALAHHAYQQTLTALEGSL